MLWTPCGPQTAPPRRTAQHHAEGGPHKEKGKGKGPSLLWGQTPGQGLGRGPGHHGADITQAHVHAQAHSQAHVHTRRDPPNSGEKENPA